MNPITKRDAKTALEIGTDAELARFFDVNRWAVGQWPDDEPLPNQRQWELRARRPDLFAVPKSA